MFSDFVRKAIEHPKNEIAALLLGRVEGRFLRANHLMFAAQVGTAVNVEISPQDFDRASEFAKKLGLRIIGWAHTHPTYGVWMSSFDKAVQRDGQALFPD